MFRTPKVGTRALAGIATIATLTGVTLPLMATAASAAVNSVTATSPASPSQAGAGNTAVVSVAVNRSSALDVTAIRFVVVSGPDTGTNAPNAADGTCTPAGNATTVSCTVTNGGTAGTDLVRVFADTNDNSVLDSGEPTSDATVVFYGPAAAVDLKPDSDSAAAGTCNAFTATVTDAGGRVVPSQQVRLISTLTGTVGSRTLVFCNPGTTNPTSTDAGFTSAPAAGTANSSQSGTGTVTTDPNGKATFGIRSDQPGGATVQAYIDNNTSPAANLGTFQAGEPTDTSTKTFTAGGAAGNAAQDAVATLSVSPATQSSVAGEATAVHYTVTAKNSAGDTVPNVIVSAAIISGPNAGATVTCSPATTNNSGTTDCSYTPTAAAGAGTDTIRFFVNQSTGATGGFDPNEPTVTATNTISAAPSGNAITLTCADSTAVGATTTACKQPVSTNTEVFTAFVSKGTNTDGSPKGAAGILVRFTVTSGTGTVSPTSAVTDASGIAKTTLTQATPVNGTTDQVTATIAGQTPATSASATTTFQTPVTTTVTLTPVSNTTQSGSASTFVATVTDQFNKPVVGASVVFAISGAGNRNSSQNSSANNTKTSDSTGKATFTYTDLGSSTTGGTDLVTATANGVSSSPATNTFIPEPATAASVDLDVTNAAPVFPATVGTCPSGATEPANDAATYAPSRTARPVCAKATTAAGNTLAGKTVTFTLTGVGSFVSNDGKNTALTSPQTAVIGPNGYATVYVESTKSGAQTITATIDGKSDTGTITYSSPLVSDARNVDLKPDTGNLTNGSHELTALVTDQFGNPVSGVQVDFTETGPAQFSNGTSSSSATTGATGTVTVTLTSPVGTTGTDAVTATIAFSNPSSTCAQAAGSPTGATAGNCSDTSTYTFKSATAPTITVSPTALNVGQYATVVVHGTAGDAVQLLAYSRPNTTYGVVRSGTIGSNGTVTFSVGPRTNTRLFAKTAGGSSTSAVISVRPAESLFGTATGKVGSFHGGIVPGHSGVTVRLFTVKNGVRSSSPVGTAVTDANGKWTFRRTFAATGPVTFISQTLSDLTSLAGQSNRITITFK
jgi:hypothetical protein